MKLLTIVLTYMILGFGVGATAMKCSEAQEITTPGEYR